MEYTVRQIRPKLLSVTGTQNKNEEIEITKEFLHTYRMLFALSGHYEVYWDRCHAEVPEYSLFFFLPGNRYTIRTREVKVELLDVRFEMFPSGSLTKRPMLSNPAPDQVLYPEKHIKPLFFSDYQQFNKPFFFEVGPQTAQALESMLYEAQKDMLFARELADLYLRAALMNLLRDMSMKKEDERPNAAAKIMRYVNTHLTEPIYNEVVARDLSYHPNYINRVIKDATGLPFRKYVTEAKLRYATALLLNTNKTVTEIALTLCFHSSSHFTDLFREFYHCTPSEYRKKYFRE